jgi:hypothetical protein
MSASERVGQHQADRNKKDEESIGDEPHGITILLQRRRHK